MNVKPCPVCAGTAEEKHFSSFSYFYCPVCKEDVDILAKKSVPQSAKQLSGDSGNVWALRLQLIPNIDPIKDVIIAQDRKNLDLFHATRQGWYRVVWANHDQPYYWDGVEWTSEAAANIKALNVGNTNSYNSQYWPVIT
jgi:hypothetical protein